MIEVRGHARGGQGMVTAFEILAKIFSQIGDLQVQSFPAFGVERTGAPIQAFLRIAHHEILNRSNGYHPHLIVVFDETLIEQVPVFEGLREQGAILLNTERGASEFKKQAKNVYTVPATQISIDKGLGSKSLPIVNAAMMGAIVRILKADIAVAARIISENVPAKPQANAEAARLAYNSVVEGEGTESGLATLLRQDEPSTAPVEVSDFAAERTVRHAEADFPTTPAWSEPMSRNKTGNWRALTPKYEVRQAPCITNCPAGTDVRLFVKLAAEGDFKAAYETIYQNNPFAATCGRVCPHFCQQNCNRIELDEGLNIGAIERFLGDYGVQQEARPADIRFKEKIAVIGSGPAGLTAALRLRQKGYQTTVFEALPQPGGMMRSGIPEFRLPQRVLNQEIARIVNEGVTIKLRSKVTVQELENDYSAIVVATGSHIGTRMNIPNEALALEGIKFLHDFKLNGDSSGVRQGDQVAVIGGGNTAIDVARTVLRLGGQPTIYYRRTRQEMPAIHHEVEEAEAEGVSIEFLRAPVEIEKGVDGHLIVTMIHTELGEPDDSGRRKPLPVAGSEMDVIVDKIIMAVGQKYDDFAFSGRRIKPRQGRSDFSANVPVFCGGDMAWGGTVTEAIGSGNSVAKEVHAYLRQEAFTEKHLQEDIVLPNEINFAYYLPTASHHNPMRGNGHLMGDFSEVVGGLTAEEVRAEASRCLHCGDCYSCGNCYNYCPDAAIHIDESNRLRIDYDYCKGCGICFQECPCAAITLRKQEVDYE
ncbi:MAG: 2-oxoacid:acceptor oxidoreductase family protein [bacterium]